MSSGSKRFRIISPGGVRCVRLRYGLQLKGSASRGSPCGHAGILTGAAGSRRPDNAKEDREAHGEVESPHPGFLVAQDTCLMGTSRV